MSVDNSAEINPRPTDTRRKYTTSPVSSDSKRKALEEASDLNKPKASLIKNVRNALLAFVAGSGVAGASDKVADTHIVDTTIDTTKAALHAPVDAVQAGAHAVTEAPGNIKEVGALTVDLLTGKSTTEIKHYNEEADRKLSHEVRLSEGETIREGVKVVQAANTFSELEGSEIYVYRVPYGTAGVTEPIGTAMPDEAFSGRVLTVEDLIRPASANQKIPFDYGQLKYTNKDGKVIEGENVWVPGPNTVPINPSTPPENKDFSAY
ncbi:MAG: hypothetical protein AAB531_01140 [Patescibacteria group bacterium]